MLEHIDSDVEDLYKDLTIARVSAWQQYTIAYPTADNGAHYYSIINSAPVIGSRTPALRQYFRYVRMGCNPGWRDERSGGRDSAGSVHECWWRASRRSARVESRHVRPAWASCRTVWRDHIRSGLARTGRRHRRRRRIGDVPIARRRHHHGVSQALRRAWLAGKPLAESDGSIAPDGQDLWREACSAETISRPPHEVA